MILSDVYSPLEVLQYVCPIAITLATDRVADVRTIAFKLVSEERKFKVDKFFNLRFVK